MNSSLRFSEIAAVLLFAAATLSSSAKTFEFAAANVRCEIPDDWTVTPPQGGILLMATSPYGTRSFNLAYYYEPVSLELENPKFDRDVENGIRNVPGSTIADTGTVLMHDVLFRYVDISNTSGATPRNRHMLYFLGNGHCYEFGITKDGDDPTKDDELEGILQSFTFINTPKPHSGLITVWDAFQPLDIENYSVAGRIGYAFYTCFEIAVIFLCPFAALLMLTTIFYRWLFGGGLRKRKRVAV
jgi:hypothetical protein